MTSNRGLIMDKRILTLLLLLACLTGMAKTQWNIGGTYYDVDTIIFPHQAGPGVTCAKFDLQKMPLKVSVMEMDLTNPYIDLEMCMGTDKSVGCETPTSMIARNSWEGHEVVGATNGDFFATSPTSQVGIPTSGHISKEKVYISPNNRASFVLDDNHKPFIDRVKFTGTLKVGNKSFSINRVNDPRYNIVLYTRNYGPTIYNNPEGRLVLLAPQEGTTFAWKPNGVEHAVIESIEDCSGTEAIPEDKAFLWLHGGQESIAGEMNVGDEVTITFKTVLASEPGRDITFKEMIGGSNHIIMLNDQFQEDWPERHPRTCLGFNADSTRLYFVVIDGRSASSVGVTLIEAMGVFQGLGAVNAVNLDGGGSSCIVVNDEVINSPSDGSIRAVGNGCLVISTAPVDDEIGQIAFEPRCYNISQAARTAFGIWGYNQYGLLKTRTLEGCTFSCDPQVGTFDDDGTFHASITPAVGNLYATYGDGITATQPVTIMNGAMSLRDDSVVIDVYHPYDVVVEAQSGYAVDLVTNNTFTWRSNDESVCTVNEDGIVTAVSDGITYVVAEREGFKDSVLVRVQNPRARVTTIENGPLDPTTWAVKQSGGKNRELTSLPGGGFRVTYTGTTSRTPYLSLDKDVTIWGLPDTLRVRFRPGEVGVEAVTLTSSLTDKKIINVRKELTMVEGQTDYVTDFPTLEWCDTTKLANYPLTFYSVQFDTAKPTKDKEYIFDVTGLELIYKHMPAMPALVGDVNGDGEVGIPDVTALVALVLDLSSNERSDVNGDGETGIADLTALVALLLTP